MKSMLYIAVALCVILSGCNERKPDLQVEPIATVHNEVILNYGYSYETSFEVRSDSASFIAKVPKGYTDMKYAGAFDVLTVALSPSDAFDAASVLKESQVSSVATTREEQSEIQVGEAFSVARAREDRSKTRGKHVGSFEEGDATLGAIEDKMIGGVQVDGEKSSKETQIALASSYRADTEEAFMTGRGYLESIESSMYDSESHYDLSCASLMAQTTSAIMQYSSKQPQIRKKVDRESVIAGESFEYTVMIKNVTPLDLEFVEVVDFLDERLKVFHSRISVIPSSELKVEQNGGILTIRLLDGIKRGESVEIIIPTLLRTDIAKKPQY